MAVVADIRATFHNLVISRYYTCQLAGRRMLAQGKGSIMSIGSIAGVSSLGRAQSVCGMAMAAVIQMTRELSTEWAGRGVRVNCILPAQVLGANRLGPRMEPIRGCAILFSAASRPGGSASPTISRACLCCWRRMRPTGSPVRPFRWTRHLAMNGGGGAARPDPGRHGLSA